MKVSLTGMVERIITTEFLIWFAKYILVNEIDKILKQYVKGGTNEVRNQC